MFNSFDLSDDYLTPWDQGIIFVFKNEKLQLYFMIKMLYISRDDDSNV